jgi:hypothetical protein
MVATGYMAGEVPVPKLPMTLNISEPPFSVIGDGITDVSDTVQDALNNMGPGENVLLFPAGVYLMTKPLMISKQVVFRGGWIVVKAKQTLLHSLTSSPLLQKDAECCA